MDLLDDILSSMDKNQRPAIPKPDKMMQSKFVALNRVKIISISRFSFSSFNFSVEQFEEQRKIAEKERQIINNFKVKMQNKIAQFLKDDHTESIQFEPMEKVFRSVIIETAEETNTGLHCQTFGKEDRYVIVYKNAPSELELEARRYHDFTKWNKDIEAEFKRKKEEVLEFKQSTSAQDETGSQGPSKASTKKSKIIHAVDGFEALGADLNRNYGMVSTELKKDTRTIEETLNDIQQKKRQKIQHKDE